MLTSSNSTETKRQLAEALGRIAQGIERQYIGKEADLEEFVRVVPMAVRGRQELQGGEIRPTLLEILGYTEITCDDHPVITFAMAGHKVIKIVPDYVVKNAEQKDLATWELKAPAEDVDGKEPIEQLMSYCSEPKRQTPIGILFNGRKLRVFINPEYPGLGKYKRISEAPAPLFNFKHSPVLSLELDDPEPGDKAPYKLFVETLTSLNCTNLSAGAVNCARKLAEKKLKDIQSKALNAKIVKCLQEALTSPTDEIIRAVAGAIHLWEGFETPPGLDDAVRAWHEKDNTKPSQTIEAVEIQAKQSINGIVRQKVAQICTSKGYDFLVQANVKGLRFRNEGGNGYHPVPQAEGVPGNLFVGGLSTEDAKKVIYRLEAL